MKRHYHVLSGLAGLYMPDNNDIYTNRRHATAGAEETLQSYIEAKRDDCTAQTDGEFSKRGDCVVHFWEEDEDGEQVGATYAINIMDCYDSSCKDDSF